METASTERCSNLPDLVKNIVLAYCNVHVPGAERVDIYGSLHIRADDVDVAHLLLNEHFYNSRASSPTVTSGQDVEQKTTEADNANFRSGHGEQKKPQVIKNTRPWPAADRNMMTDGLGARLTSSQHQNMKPASLPSTTTQHCDAGNIQSLYYDSGFASTEAASVGDGCIKYENQDTYDDNSIVEIFDDEDDIDAKQEFDTDFKPSLMQGDEDVAYDELADYDYSNPTAADYQYSEFTPNSMQPFATNTRKRYKPGTSVAGPRTDGEMLKICSYCQEEFISDAELQIHHQQYHMWSIPPENSAYSRRGRKTSSRQVPAVSETDLRGAGDESVVKMYKCRFCGVLLKTQDGLKNHENSQHSQSKTYQCNFCSQEFFTRQAAYTHRVKFHRLLTRKTTP